jgi:hypothetical protein
MGTPACNSYEETMLVSPCPLNIALPGVSMNAGLSFSGLRSNCIDSA